MAQKPRQDRKKKVIEVLNKARAMELHAIHQYMNQHYNLDNMDYGELAGKVKLIAIDEMRHAEMFAERIKELEGFGIVCTHGPEGGRYYDGDDYVTLSIVKDFLRFGIEPRHLTMYKHFADRESAFFEALVAPTLRQKNPDARRAAAGESAREVAALFLDPAREAADRGAAPVPPRAVVFSTQDIDALVPRATHVLILDARAPRVIEAAELAGDLERDPELRVFAPHQLQRGMPW